VQPYSSGETTGAEEGIEVERRPESLDGQGALLDEGSTDRFRGRWDSIQASFVDRPREAVKEAEELLDEVFSSLTDAFGRQRSGFEEKWSAGGEPSTEDLRVAVMRYRSLFQRLLSA
jgi:hypothetical protein